MTRTTCRGVFSAARRLAIAAVLFIPAWAAAQSLTITPDPVEIYTNVSRTATCYVVRSAPTNGNVTVSLESSDTNIFYVANSVQILAGAYTSFPIIIFGRQPGTAQLTAIAGGYSFGVATVVVYSNTFARLRILPDPLNIVLSANSNGTAVVTRVGVVPGDLNSIAVVQLVSGDPAIFTVTNSVVFPADGVAITQAINALVTGFMEGSTSLTYSATNFTTTNSIVNVFTNSRQWLSVAPSPIDIVLSMATSTTAIVTRQGLVVGDLNTNTTVTLICTNPTIYSVTNSITFDPTMALSQSTNVTIYGFTPGVSFLVSTAANFIGVTTLVQVVSTPPTNALILPPQIFLGTNSPLVRQVQRTGSLLAMNVTLTVDRPLYLQVTNTVHFSAGDLATDFALLGLIETGTNYVTLTATAPGFNSASARVYISTALDTDGDGLPDLWEYLYFNNLTYGPQDDPDGDGLLNKGEEQTGLDPTNPDTDGDGISDYVEDTDGDGIANGDEQDVIGTNPGEYDTDDDGVNDGVEIDYNSIKTDGRRLTSPLDSRSPLVQRCMVMNSTGVPLPEVTGAITSRFSLAAWTLEAWVNPSTSNETGYIVSRITTSARTNFALRLVANVPVVEFTTLTGTRFFAGANAAIPSNEWTHLAGVWDPTNHTLSLYVNGLGFQSQVILQACARGPGTVMLGRGLNGFLDEVRIWSEPRSREDILTWMPRILNSFSEAGTTPVSGAIGVVYPNGDPVHERLDELGIAYTFISSSDLYDPEMYSSYRAIFFPCLCGEQAALNPQVQQYLRDFVNRGGKMYVACWSGAYVDEVFTNIADLVHGGFYSTTADVVDPEVAAAIGTNRLFIEDGWDCIQSFNSNAVNQILYDPVEVGLISFSFEYGAGKVIYTDFHSEEGANQNPAASRFLQWVVGEVAGGSGTNMVVSNTTLVAYYLFDDDGMTAEDFTHRLDWSYALSGVNFSTNNYADLMGIFDQDIDGIPDWWENLFFGGTAIPDEDFDGDGLSNLFEYNADTCPNAWDSNNDGVYDTEEDSDADDLSNFDEQAMAADPRSADTDDDGVSDGEEKRTGTSPVDSLDPFVQRVLRCPGSSYMQIGQFMNAQRYALTNFTLEAWVYPQTDADGGLIVSRQVGPRQVNYELGLTNIAGQLLPYARVTPFAGTNNMIMIAPARYAMEIDAWTHLAVTLNGGTRELALFLNGVKICNLLTVPLVKTQGVGPVRMRVGDGFTGYIDEVRVWSVPLSATQIDTRMHSVVSERLAELVGYFRFDDDGVMCEDFQFPADWLAKWNHAGRLFGGAAMVDVIPAAVPVAGEATDTDNDGLPDSWEIANFGNLTTSNGQGDYDGDELSDYYEYLAGTDPRLIDSDYNDIRDCDEDSDGDGLTNYQEQTRGTHPGRTDTDDDASPDGVELTPNAIGVISSPLYSMGAYSLAPRALSLTNIPPSGIVVPQSSSEIETRLYSWTIEGWFYSDNAAAQTGTILRKSVGGRASFSLGLVAGIPYTAFETIEGIGVTNMADAGAGVSNSTWTHLAGSWDAIARELKLYVNGLSVYSLNLTQAGYAPSVAPQSLSGVITIGRSPAGWTAGSAVDNIRIWDSVLPQTTLDEGRHAIVSIGSDMRLLRDFRFDDGGVSIEDFKHPADGNYALYAQAYGIGTNASGHAEWLTTNAPVFYGIDDSDGDGIPDWWMSVYAQTETYGDPDGDGLGNFYEYLSATDPTKTDTDGDGVLDDVDRYVYSDGSTNDLTNLEEQQFGCDPRYNDTDDDGVSDSLEIKGGGGWFESYWPVSDPTMALRNTNTAPQVVRRSINFNGNSRIMIPPQLKYALASWTVDAWIKPAAGGSGTNIILRRAIRNLGGGAEALNYELGLHHTLSGAVQPYVRFVSTNGQVAMVGGAAGTNTSGNITIPSDGTNWTYIGGVFDGQTRVLSLYINGTRVGTNVVSLGMNPPVTGPNISEIEVTIGGGRRNGATIVNGFNGQIDEVRISASVLDPNEMAIRYRAVEADMVGGYTVGKNAIPGQVAKVGVLTVEDAVAMAHVPGQLVVRFQSYVAASAHESYHRSLGTRLVKKHDLVPVDLVEIEDGSTVAQKLAIYRADLHVLYAEPNYTFELVDTIPNDPYFPNQWGLHNTGQTGGKEGADINGPGAWDKTRGSDQVTIAVIDTGIDYTHPDLAGNMWVNPAEIPGNGIDDDNNGYVDDVYGYDFSTRSSDPMDYYGHGTHVAGIIGAIGNNGVGVAGINWKVKVMAIKIGDYWVSLDAAIEGLQYATKMGARISNNSWGGYGYSQALRDAIEAAGLAGHLFVAAAGNDANDNDQFPMYPASYDLENIVAVAASDDHDELAYFSNYGKTTVDLAAPGLSILSTMPGNSYETMSGTSMATPHVTGVGGLIMANQVGVTYKMIKSLLLNGVDKLESMEGLMVANGRLSAARAMVSTGGSVAYFRCDDGGTTVEDMTVVNDILQGWRHAGILDGAQFDSSQFADMPGDVDSDGMPDWFETAYGVGDPMGDQDADDLENLFECLAGTNPHLADTDNDDQTDDIEDADGDGIFNIDEQAIGSSPGLLDTDDDGLPDAVELAAGLNPAVSLHPYTNRVLVLDGAADPVRLPLQPRFALDAGWTIEGWVRLDPDETDGFALISRRVGANGINYEIGVNSAQRPYARFVDMAGNERMVTGVTAIASGSWIHLAGSFDSAAHELNLLVDGVRVAHLGTSVILPAAQEAGVVSTVIGDRLKGRIDDIRIWSVPRSTRELYDYFYVILGGNEQGLVANYRLDDSTSFDPTNATPVGTSGGGGLGRWVAGQIEDFVVDYPDDWLTKWHNAATIASTGAWRMTERDGLRIPQMDSDGDGLPDWWEWKYFNSLSISDGAGDTDGDGLSDMSEYKAGTDPTKYSTYGSVWGDGDIDSDGDGISNNDEEKLYKSNPGKLDTDDDGVRDNVEIDHTTSAWHPMSVWSPETNLNNMAQRRSLAMGMIASPATGLELPARVFQTITNERTGTIRVESTNRFAFGTNGWTIELWVNPGVDGDGDLFIYEAVEGFSARLSLTNGAPHGVIWRGTNILVQVGGPIALASSGKYVGAGPLITNKWTHLAMVWAPEANSLRLYEDSVLLIAQETLAVADLGPGRAFLARNFQNGFIDEVRVWNRVRETQEIEAWYEKIFPAPGYVSRTPDGEVPPHVGPFRSDYTKIRNDIDELPLYAASYQYGQPLVAYYRFDDGGGYIEDFAHMNEESYYLNGQEAITNSPASPVRGVDDADGDGLPEWWLELHGLDRFPQVHEGPYHVLDPMTGSDYPVTYVEGWTTPLGTIGSPRGLYYNTEISPDEYNVPIYQFNVWLDVNPDYDPYGPGVTNEPPPHDGLGGPYRGRGQYDEWDIQVWADYDDWFTPTNTMGRTGMFFHDLGGAQADLMYTPGEDIWLERYNVAADPVFDLQQIIGINYCRTFTAYASLGDHFAWTFVDPGNTNNQEPEINWYATTKSTDVGRDGLYSCFTKYVYLDQTPRTASMKLSLFGTMTNLLYVNGQEYDPGRDPTGLELVRLLKRGRNQLYLYTVNSPAVGLLELYYHYIVSYGRTFTAVKFDMSMKVNDVDVVVRGDESTFDPRAVWHGQAWSEYWDAFAVMPLSDMDLRLVYHQDYGIARDAELASPSGVMVGDGLENNAEFLIGMNPRDFDTDNNGVPDSDEDYDGDGLLNYEEIVKGSEPQLADTDDDGELDGVEISNNGNPASSIVRLVPRAAIFKGSANEYLEMPIQSRFALRSWTIEAWVNPASGWTGDGTIVRRQTGIAGGPQETYFLAISNLLPIIRFGSESLWGPTPIPNSGTNWTHLAAMYDADTRRLSLMIDTNLVSTNIIKIPMRYGSGPIVQRIGEGFDGELEELRIWDHARLPEVIIPMMAYSLSGSEEGLVAYYRFDDSTSDTGPAPLGVSAQPYWKRGHVEDYVTKYANDWKMEWTHAATIVGSYTTTNLTPATSPIRIDIDTDGDGMPDWWEIQYEPVLDHLDPTGQYGADGDPDNDGISNLQEYYLGFDPTFANLFVSVPTNLVVQVGDYADAWIILPAVIGATSTVANLYSSDETLFVVNPDVITFSDNVRSNLVRVFGIALGEGLGSQNGVLLALNANGGGLQLPVTVSNGINLTLSMDVASSNNVVAGDTVTMKVQRERSAVGHIEMPLTVYLSSSQPDKASVPDTIVIPGGSDEMWFTITGIQVAQDVVIKAQAVGYPISDYVIDVEAPTITTWSGGYPVDPINIPVGATQAIQLVRDYGHVAAALTLDLLSSSSSVFAVSLPGVAGATNNAGSATNDHGSATNNSLTNLVSIPVSVTFTAGQAAVWIVLTGGAQTNTALLLANCGEPVLSRSVVIGTTSDADSDGLPDWFEVLAGTDPYLPDSDVDGVPDADEDLDNDGLTNIQEYEVGSHPLYPDTDDDGILDGDDPAPINALVPLVDRVLSLDGAAGSYVEMPADPALALTNFTLMAWVYPIQTNACQFIKREVQSSTNNYRLGMGVTRRVTVSYHPSDRSTNVVSVTAPVINALPTGQWSHVAATFDKAQGRLSLYINGVMVGGKTTTRLPLATAFGPVVARIGESFGGKLDEVAIFGTALSDIQIQEAMLGVAVFEDEIPVAYYRFEDGTSATNNGAGVWVGTSCRAGKTDEQVMDCTGRPQMDFANGYTNGATLRGNIAIAAAGTNAPVLYLNLDRDGDGMPDAWEIAYDLNPLFNDAYLDPDLDGLDNLYEYFAGTDPHVKDTDFDGYGDYDSRSNNYSRTYGELFDDGDRIPDNWEINYNGFATNGNPGLDPSWYDANIDPDLDGWDNLAEFMGSYLNSSNVLTRSSNPLDPTSYPQPRVRLHGRYNGRLGDTLDYALVNNPNSMFRVDFYGTSARDGFPMARLAMNVSALTTRTFTSGHLRQGMIYTFAYLDLDGSGTYDPATEPGGVSSFNMSWGDLANGFEMIDEISLPVFDTLPGYPRFSWTIPTGIDYVPGAGTLVKLYVNGTTLVLQRQIKGNRNYLHEGDYIRAGVRGLPQGSYTFQTWHKQIIIPGQTQWFLEDVQIYGQAAYTLTTPQIITPHDVVFKYARNEYQWKMSTNSTYYILQVSRTNNLAGLIRAYTNAPMAYYDENDIFRSVVPFYARDTYAPGATFGNSRFWWRLVSASPSATANSAWQAFKLNLKTPVNGGKSVISGDLYYFGKVAHGYGTGQTNLIMIVQSFQSPGFSGQPDAQVQVNYFCNTNVPTPKKGGYVAMGLHSAPQYLRAFIDLNANRALDSFEPWGYAQDPSDPFSVRKIYIPTGGLVNVSGVNITIRDVDTDNDMLPDSWEWMYYGTLSKGANDLGANNITLLQNYETELFDLNPTIVDYDGDGLSDYYELTYSDRKAGRPLDPSDYDPYDPVLNPDGKDLNAARKDTDGDGMNDKYEIDHGTDPLSRNLPFGADRLIVTGSDESLLTGDDNYVLRWNGVAGVTYKVQFSSDLKTWFDAPDGERSGVGPHEYIDSSSSAVQHRYFRVVIIP